MANYRKAKLKDKEKKQAPSKKKAPVAKRVGGKY
jgi:hypothetical protein